MTSTGSVAGTACGRTWFGTDANERRTCTQYMGIRVPLEHMRRNACTLSDFQDSEDARARHQLLRMFLRVNYRLMQCNKVGSGSAAFIEWDSTDALRLPSCFWLHVLYEPADPNTNVGAEAVTALAALASEDSKLLHKAGVDHTQLMLRADTWGALCSTYTGVMLIGDDYSVATPCDVYTPARAGVTLDNGVFQGRHTCVQMCTTDLEHRLFFAKYCPWYQSRQLPELPIFCTDERAATLLRLSRMVPDPVEDDLQSVWEKLKARAERAKGREDYVSWAREEVCHSLTGSQAGYVPKSEHALNVYFARPVPVVPYADATLTPFATWVARFLMDCEAYAFLYKQHALLLKLLMGSLDVYREASNGQIHYSAILAGPNSTSKSFVFTLLEDFLVPGTVSRATRRTENAFTYNRDQGSRVLIDHEMAGDFFGDSSTRKDGSARTAQTKEVLTSHEATTESCQMVDGQRVMSESTSRAHIAYLAATNDWSIGQSRSGEDNKDSALVSRFDLIFPTRGGEVKNKSIMALMAADRDPTPVEKVGKAALVEWVRTMQLVTYWTQRSVHIGAIQPVNMDAAHAVVELYASRTPLSPRTIERILIIARQLCIVTAIMILYGHDKSPRKGEVPLAEHVPELEPYLVITAEQTKFSLGLFEAELCNRVQRPVAMALRMLSYRPDPDLGFNYLRVVGCDTSAQLVDELMMHIPEGCDVSKDLITAHLSRMREDTVASKPFVPSVGAPHGMAEDPHARQQQYYKLRGMSFHIKCIEGQVPKHEPLEGVLHGQCHVGPPGRELTAVCAKGYAHLLLTRTNEHEMRPFTQQGMFMPEVSATLMGPVAKDTLELMHRCSSEKVIDEPPEIVAMNARGAIDLVDFAQQCAMCTQQHAMYPDDYRLGYETVEGNRKRTRE
jgi:hypothetical protein